jgi:crossover junction endodeoxyribonuclease RuvC
LNGSQTRVLGIDTSLRATGYGVVESAGSRLVCVEFGTLRNPAARRHSECLSVLYGGVTAAIERTAPHAAAVEGAFFFKNAKTAMILGEARGAVIAACAARGVPVYEYAPRRVKQAIVGVGGASKEQVGRMIMSLLGLREMPGDDESDALAIAICHLHGKNRYGALRPEPI